MSLSITHQGIRTESAAATFNLGTSLTEGYDEVGRLVSMSSTLDFTVEKNVDGAPILGMLESYEDRSQEGLKTGAVTWQICVKAPYSGAAPVRGKGLVCDATDGVKAAPAGEGLNAIVTAVDTSAKTVEFILR